MKRFCLCLEKFILFNLFLYLKWFHCSTPKHLIITQKWYAILSRNWLLLPSKSQCSLSQNRDVYMDPTRPWHTLHQVSTLQPPLLVFHDVNSSFDMAIETGDDGAHNNRWLDTVRWAGRRQEFRFRVSELFNREAWNLMRLAFLTDESCSWIPGTGNCKLEIPAGVKRP